MPGREGGLERWVGHWPLQARASEKGKPAKERVGQRGSLLLASHQACQEHGWFLPHGRGEVERERGLVLYHWRELSYKYKLTLSGAHSL